MVTHTAWHGRGQQKWWGPAHVHVDNIVNLTSVFYREQFSLLVGFCYVVIIIAAAVVMVVVVVVVVQSVAAGTVCS